MTASATQRPPEAERLENEFKNLVYNLSHDLGSPLRGMVEFSRLLKDECAASLSDDAKTYLSLIVDSGEKAQAMLAALTQYALLDASTKPFTTVNLNDIADHCKGFFEEAISASGAMLNIQLLPIVTGDKARLTDLFKALLDNALKFNSPQTRPSIHITVEDNGAEWSFTIRDNGIGIMQDFYAKVFQPFGRLHADNKYPGVGMGLANAKRIVERHGGNICLKPMSTQGLSVNFTLPKAN